MERRSDGPRLALEATRRHPRRRVEPAIYSRIVNASQRGMQLVMPDSRPVGTRIRVTVSIEEPPREITVAGIIVHTAPWRTSTRASRHVSGSSLTETGEDWRALCDSLARLAAEENQVAKASS